MSKKKKFFLIFASLILGTFIFPLFTNYQSISPKNVEFVEPEKYPLVGKYMPEYLYWGSTIILSLLIIFILILIFIPQNRIDIKIIKGSSTLKINKNAIVSLVKSQTEQIELLRNVHVKVKINKKKIKIYIIGNVEKTNEALKRVNHLVEEINKYIKEFIGIETPINVEVFFKNMTHSVSSKKNKKRVV